MNPWLLRHFGLFYTAPHERQVHSTPIGFRTIFQKILIELATCLLITIFGLGFGRLKYFGLMTNATIDARGSF
jgi:hypothetical protein